MPKIAVVKLGSRITWDTDGAVAPGEAISICKVLTVGGADVHVFTKILEKDTLHESITWHDLSDAAHCGAIDLEQFDVLVVINGNVNFYGGGEPPEQLAVYWMINNFPGKVVYIMCDPELPLTQVWPSVSKKPWGAKYSEKDLNITRTDIQVLSQPYNLEGMKEHWNKRGVQVSKFFHFPMELFPLMNVWSLPANEPSVDLLYGGTPRGGRRIPNLYKWYCGLPDDISVEIFGSIDASDFEKHPKIGKLPTKRYPIFTGKVKYSQVITKMNTGLAHLVTGDGSYEELDIIPQRTMENIAAGNVVFVDANMDKSRRIYPEGTLANRYLYVSSQEELVQRLREVKGDWTLRYELLKSAIQAQGFVANDFCESLVNVITKG
jgi:hypothetical protein